MLNASTCVTTRESPQPRVGLGIPSLKNLGRGSSLIKVPCIDSQNILSWTGSTRVIAVQLLDLQRTTPGATPCPWEHSVYLCNYTAFMQLCPWRGWNPEIQEQRNISNILLQTAYRGQTFNSPGMLAHLAGCTQVNQSWLHMSVESQQCTAAISEAGALVPPL